MKPSEQISKRASEMYHLRLATIARSGVTVDMATQRFESGSADASAICDYLDTEAEAEVLERIGLYAVEQVTHWLPMPEEPR